MKILTLAWVVIFQVAFLTNADARGGGRGGSGKSYSSVSHSSYSSKGKSRSSISRSSSGYASGSSDSCPCSGSNDCIGPRGGIYCYTSGGNKRYR
ncbi:hypothetical protein [Acinetobacter soli]|uniref:hypothetical protein n=1 Tax=Acinetobacter soli TaxID=487316 RepID=UPI000DD02EF1|nr:hypothetical protein [Acinetobacter soli]RSB52611.1 hypothetical protein EGK59_10755 [Acinetobacter soli]